MKNVTISMDDALAHEVRVEAAKAGKSMSKYIAEVMEATLRPSSAAATKRNPQQEALERFLAGPALHIAVEGRMPTAEERNERR